MPAAWLAPTLQEVTAVLAEPRRPERWAPAHIAMPEVHCVASLLNCWLLGTH